MCEELILEKGERVLCIYELTFMRPPEDMTCECFLTFRGNLKIFLQYCTQDE